MITERSEEVETLNNLENILTLNNKKSSQQQQEQQQQQQQQERQQVTCDCQVGPLSWDQPQAWSCDSFDYILGSVCIRNNFLS